MTAMNDRAKAISPDLFGIFFEDLNWAADGGLYAELLSNRSFEYQAVENPAWNALTGWEFERRGGGEGSLGVDGGIPVHPNNPTYAIVNATVAGEGVGLSNTGFDGLPVKAGELYDLSFFARQLYMERPWGGRNPPTCEPMPVTVRLEAADGEVLAETELSVAGGTWQRYTGVLTARRTEARARFVLLLKARGGVALDDISLFPRKTFRGRTNGLRADLAQAIADLRPKFVRFPGGCLAHGNGIGNIYRWQDTIGPVEQRRGQANIWGYHQSVGLGYYEYFQFCEDIGAKPLPVVAAGVCCQNSSRTSGIGQRGIPLEAMPAYIQDVLNLIEWANGPATSTWGAKRAAAGHPAPFGLEYLGVGNEDHITPLFRERFKMIHDAVKAKHPGIIVVGTVGPNHSGPDYEEGWKIAHELGIAMVDEHYYERPEWFLEHLSFYDGYDRTKSRVYLGEYAAHEPDRRNTLRTALAEAAYMTSLERNGDVVALASYAPLLARVGHTQWNPDLIYFTGTDVLLTANYYVQQMFSRNSGDAWYPVTVPAVLSASCVKDSASRSLIIKLVNVTGDTVPVALTLPEAVKPEGIRTVLTGDPEAVNTFEKPGRVIPVTETIAASPRLALEVLPGSLTVLRFELQ